MFITILLVLHTDWSQASLDIVELVQLIAHHQVNSETQTAENLYYKALDPAQTDPSRRDQTHGRDSSETTSGEETSLAPATMAHSDKHAAREGAAETQSDTAGENTKTGKPRFLFATAAELDRICHEQDMTIAQVVWENEKAFKSDGEIREGLMACEWSEVFCDSQVKAALEPSIF